MWLAFVLSLSLGSEGEAEGRITFYSNYSFTFVGVWNFLCLVTDSQLVLSLDFDWDILTHIRDLI